MARGKDWRCYTFRRCSSPFVVEVSCLPTDFGGGGRWINRNGDVGLDRSFETSQRTPKTESGIKRYGQNRFLKFQFFRKFGSTGQNGSVVPARVNAGPVVPEIWAVVPAVDAIRARNSKFRDFGRKNGSKMTKSEGKSMELGHGNAKEGRSTSIAIDLWIKICKTHSNHRLIQKQIGAIFGGNF